jgi:hypothetical protein
MTPESESNWPIQGSRPRTAVVCTYPGFPTPSDAGRTEIDVLGVVLAIELRRQRRTSKPGKSQR